MPFVDNDGVKIRYEVEGEGPPLFLVHGLSARIETWYRAGYVDDLSRRFRLVLVDPRGHGQSDKPHDPEAYQPRDFAADFCAVLDSLNIESAHYFGYSMGGRMGFSIASLHPQRLLSFIAGGASPAPSPEIPIGLENGLQFLVDMVSAEMNGLGKETEKDILANDIDALKALVSPTAYDKSELWANSLPDLKVPSLFFAGTDDHRHDGARQLAESMPNAEFVSLPGVSHSQAGLEARRALPHLNGFFDRLHVD